MKNLLLNVLLSFLTFSMLPAETAVMDAQTEEAYQLYLERASGNVPKKMRPGQAEFLFTREFSCYSCEQNVAESMRVFQCLHKRRPKQIYFRFQDVSFFDQKGTCSAMALDFLARYLESCAEITDPIDCASIIKTFKPYYRANVSTFSSRQASYNTITVDTSLPVLSETAKEKKIQALANYHNLTIAPATPSIDIQHPEIEALVNQLAAGNYILRALSPAENKKGEWYGHTMILIKKPEKSIFYDNYDGAVVIHGDVGEYVKEQLESWHIPEFRFYAVDSLRQVENISTQTTPF